MIATCIKYSMILYICMLLGSAWAAENEVTFYSLDGETFIVQNVENTPEGDQIISGPKQHYEKPEIQEGENYWRVKFPAKTLTESGGK